MCRQCGETNDPDAWLCECGQDLREVGATLHAGSEPARRSRVALWLLGAPVGFAVALGAAGVLTAASRPPGFWGSDFDMKIDGGLGAAAGLVLGLVVGVVAVGAHRRRASRR